MTPNDPLIPGGCIYLARKMLDSDLMDQSPLVAKLWLWLLLKANWKDRDKLKRGQLVTTITEMQEAMSHHSGWRKITPTMDQIRSAYGTLRLTARIATQRTTRGMIVTILNYEYFQDISSYASRTVSRDGNATCPAAIPHDTEEGEEEKKENKPSSSPKPQKSVSPDALRLSNILADMILENQPQNRSLNNGKRGGSVQAWAADIDKLICIDKQSLSMIETVIRWSQTDVFWKSNILSGTTLRKQWDRLISKLPVSLEPAPAALTPEQIATREKIRNRMEQAKAKEQEEADRWAAMSEEERHESKRRALAAHDALIKKMLATA